MTILTHFVDQIRGNAPTWSYTSLLVGWKVLTVLTLISCADLAYRLFRPDHGLKP